MAILSRQTFWGLAGGGTVGATAGLAAGVSLSCGVSPGSEAAPALCDALSPVTFAGPANLAMRAHGAIARGCANVVPKTLYLTRLPDKAADWIAAARGHIEDKVPWANEATLMHRLPHAAYPLNCDFDLPAAGCPDPLAYLRAERLGPWMYGASCVTGLTVGCALTGAVAWSWYPESLVFAANLGIAGVDFVFPAFAGRELGKQALTAARDHAAAHVQRVRAPHAAAALDAASDAEVDVEAASRAPLSSEGTPSGGSQATGDSASIASFHTALDEQTPLLQTA